MKSDSAPWWVTEDEFKTETTWSPLIGCSRISDGCSRCWAERFARRHAANQTLPPATRRAYQDVADWDGTIRLLPHMLDVPRHWRKPRVVLTCAMTDLFHEQTPFAWQQQILAIASAYRRHQFVIATKRPQNALKVLNALGPDWEELRHSNVWLGASICNQADADRMLPSLCELAKRGWPTFLHCEPMVGDFDLDAAYDQWRHVSCRPRWIIVGGESGPGARMTEPHWVRCLKVAARSIQLPFWFKGWGRHVPPGQQPGKLDGKTWRQRPQELTT